MLRCNDASVPVKDRHIIRELDELAAEAEKAHAAQDKDLWEAIVKEFDDLYATIQVCVLEAGHDGDHADGRGKHWSWVKHPKKSHRWWRRWR